MTITLYNRQRKLPLPLADLRRLAPELLRAVLAHRPGPETPALPGLDEVEVTFVSDATIARVHREFMDIPGPTDVITFDHGEIIISTETASGNAPLYERSFLEELALYIVHGLLHLNGYGDGVPAQARRMAAVQEKLLRETFTKVLPERATPAPAAPSAPAAS